MYHNLKAFQVKCKLKLVKGKKTPSLDNDVIMNAQKDHLNTRIELGGSDFPDQRILVSKNSYVAKNQTKMPVGVTFWFPVYPTIKQLRRQRQWKHLWEKELAFIFSSSRLFSLAGLVNFLELNTTGRLPRRERRIRRGVFKSYILKSHVVVLQWTSMECTEKSDARAELLFCW